MTQTGNPQFQYNVFDETLFPTMQYHERLQRVEDQLRPLQSVSPDLTTALPHEWRSVDSREAVEDYERQCLARGFEGIMLRNPFASYKYGRSTLRQQMLIKLKRFKDAEAVITGFEALEHNTNEQTRDAFGLAKRSSHQAGRVADNLLGTLIVEHPVFGAFGIGTGFDLAQRESFWENRDSLLGKTVTFKYQETGVKDKPRFPVFKGFRPET
jgi:DNA ligase-1